MARREVARREEHIRFVVQATRGAWAFTDLCGQFGISRKTGYTWVARYQTRGLDGLHELTRQPRASPMRVLAAAEALRRSGGPVIQRAARRTVACPRRDGHQRPRWDAPVGYRRSFVNDAVTLAECSSVTVQVALVPVQAPLQLMTVAPGAGVVAVRVTLVPAV